MAANAQYGNVLKELVVGSKTLKNRVALTAHTYGLLDGTPQGSEKMGAYIGARAEGGVALCILGETSVAPAPSSRGDWGAAQSGEHLNQAYDRLVRIQERTGCHIVDQLYLPGGQVWHEEGVAAQAPSSISQPRSGVLPRAMTFEEVDATRGYFVSAMCRARDHGLSGVEIKADQGKLIHQFLAARYNHRDDKYGGRSLIARARYLLDLLTDLRQESQQLLIGVRLPLVMSEHSLARGDVAPEELIGLVRLIGEEGLCDYVSLSCETNASAYGYVLGHPDPETDVDPYWLAVKSFRAAVTLPVLGASGVTSLEGADVLLEGGFCDIVGMTRAHIADPALIRNSLTFGPQAVRPCIQCNQGCVGSTWYGEPISCTLNPRAGRESLMSPPAASRRAGGRVCVVGAGPAGLEAALAFASAGRKVTVFESAEEIGGQLRLARRLPGLTLLSEYLEFLRHSLKSAKSVNLSLGTRVDPLVLLGEDFDKVICATGTVVGLPSGLSGMSRVLTDVEAITADEDWAGRKVLIWDSERYRNALSLAVWFIRQGATVDLATPFDTVGLGFDPATVAARLRELRAAKVVIRTWVHLEGVTDSGMVYLYDQITDGVVEVGPFDAVVPMVNGLSERFMPHPKLAVVGDAQHPRGIRSAISDSMNLER